MKMRYSKSGLKRLASDLLQQHWLFLLATIGTIVQVALTIYLPILIGNAIDSVLLSDASQHLLPILSKMGMVIVANTAIQWLNPLIYNQLIYSYSQKLRDAVIQKIHRLPLAYLDHQGSGDLVSRLTTDVEQLNNGLLMVFNQFFVGVLTILVTIVTMAKIDFFMMMLVLLLTPLSMLIARFIAHKSYKLFQKQTTARGLQTQLIEESFSQESLIHSFNAQEQFITDFTKGNESYADYSQDAIFYSSTVNPATRFVNALIYAIVVGFGAVRIINGSSFTVGQLVTFLNYVNQYTKPFNDISSVMAELQSALACAERLYMILDEKEVVVDLKYYAEGIIPAEDYSREPGFSLKEQVNVGDEVSATVVSKDDGNGNILLSRTEAADVLAWDKLKELKDSKEVIDVVVKGIVNGGVIAYVEGVRGFIPASKLALNYVEDTNEYLNKPIQVQVFDIDKEKGRLILSAKEILREKAEEERKTKISNVQVGLVTEGVVESLQPYGAFVDLGNGLSGLVHISQICEKRIKKPSEVLTVGDKVKVKVTAVKDGKLSLSIKEATDMMAKEIEEEVIELPDSKEEASTSLGALFANIKLDN